MLEHEGTSYEKWNSNEIIISIMFKDEEITKLDEIKFLKVKSEEFMDNVNVIILKDKCFSIKFTTTKLTHTPDEINEIVEEFENEIEDKYIPFYNGLRHMMG
ncbi:hypothetical protein [Methanobacterium formicicum]|uniref:Uncharacterized protein n=1 Tax=Methanobacterium formicicum TaxID=2162 RepID=A0A843AUV6_METFO|nr:hypothetical protein [Methanobacterium formicicum]MBF4474515.1 hypothetical protein [Methanobacterium formicicum]